VEEKRRHSRVSLAVEITCKPAGGEAFKAVAKDISLGGMLVASEVNPLFGTQMIIVVQLPGQKAAFDLPCVVRWNLPEGFGVQFGLLGAKETHAITKLG
jgi:c-di-GMP-binding flagellar brake protein YcgR